jgi:hypothetical protein
LTAPAQLVLGAQQTLNYYLNGDIAEVKIYDGALSDTDRTTDENSLKCKYGLGLGGLPPAPSNLAALTDNRLVFLNWYPTVGADSYTLYRSTNNGVSYGLMAAGITATNYMDANASPGRTNYYKVASVSNCGSGSASAGVGVGLSQPALGAGLDTVGGTFTISWPIWGNNWTLWSATNLAPPSTWSPVTNSIGTNNGQVGTTLPVGPGSLFFRLTSP